MIFIRQFPPFSFLSIGTDQPDFIRYPNTFAKLSCLKMTSVSVRVSKSKALHDTTMGQRENLCFVFGLASYKQRAYIVFRVVLIKRVLLKAKFKSTENLNKIK